MTTKLKAALLAALLAAGALAPAAAQTRGEKTLGVKAGYASRNESAIAGIFFRYRFSRHFELAPDIDYVFRRSGTDALLFNIDTHYPFALGTSGRWEVYPIAGITYASWNYQSDDVEVTTRRNRMGINVGAGLDFRVTPTMRLTLQGRYNCVSRTSTALITLGLGYTF